MVFVVLSLTVLLISSLESVHFVKAGSPGSIGFSGGVTLNSPVNTTYDCIPILSLDFADGGLHCTLNYSVDGINQGVIPLVYAGSTETMFIANMTGRAQLPQLSVGIHNLTITQEANLNGYGGASPPGAPFKETAPGSGNYVAVWVDTVDFTISTIAGDLSSPNITNLPIENQTYNSTNIPMNFTVDRSILRAAYSLDGQANVTIAANSTLTGLAIGAHNVTLYVWDASEKVGASQTVNFNVANNSSAQVRQPDPFPLSTVIAVFISFMVGAALTFLFFFRKNTDES